MKKTIFLRWILAVCLVIVILCVGYAFWLLLQQQQQQKQQQQQQTTIFTCTTFFDFEKQDKWTAFCKAIDSIQELHTPATLGKIDKWFIVNEYASNHKRDWAKAVHEKYPFIEVYQKGPEEKGQAASMNIILQKIKRYTYWIHWEETWYCRSTCIDRMFDVIHSTSITQLQVTQHKEKPNWLDSDAHPKTLLRTHSGTNYYRIYPSPDTEHYVQKNVYEYDSSFISKWPLYSLLPSINRVSDYHLGDFSTDPVLWPIKFEWDYGRRWFLAGNTKAVLPDGPVIRDNSKHKSTYS